MNVLSCPPDHYHGYKPIAPGASITEYLAVVGNLQRRGISLYAGGDDFAISEVDFADIVFGV